MSNFWLVATNGTRARIFAGTAPSAALEEIECLVNPAGGQQERDLASDRPGRNRDDSVGHRSAVGESHQREQSLDEFARRIADYLEDHRAEGAFDQLSIVAAPAMLGRLRESVTKGVQAATLEEIDKDLTAQDAAEIQSRLTVLRR